MKSAKSIKGTYGNKKDECFCERDFVVIKIQQYPDSYRHATQEMMPFVQKLVTIKQKIFIALITIFFFAACDHTSHTNKQIFYYNETTGVATLDPAFAKNQSVMWVVHQLYNTLVEIDSNLNIVPSLAKSWEISTDRTTYTFHLRNDVYFQDNDVFANMSSSNKSIII